MTAPQKAIDAGAATRSHETTRYLISFDDGAMAFPEEELSDVAEAAHAVVQEAEDSGAWVFGGGLYSEVSVVATDGTLTDGPYSESKAYIGGFAVVDVPSREEALEWTGAGTDDIDPRVAAEAMMAWHRSPIEFTRQRALSRKSSADFAYEIRLAGERALTLLEDGSRRVRQARRSAHLARES